MTIRVPEPGQYVPPVVSRFPVCLPPNFVPTDFDKDGVDRNWRGKDCPGYDPEGGYAPKSGGGYAAKRGAGYHRAWDIMAAEGAPLVAMADGHVAETTVLRRGGSALPGVGWLEKGGHYLVLQDTRGTDWYFAHMVVEPCVVPGQEVQAGDHLGWMGRTGNAHYETSKRIVGCPHLHLRGKDKHGVYFPPERHLLHLLHAGAWKWREAWQRPKLLTPEK